MALRAAGGTSNRLMTGFQEDKSLSVACGHLFGYLCYDDLEVPGWVFSGKAVGYNIATRSEWVRSPSSSARQVKNPPKDFHRLGVCVRLATTIAGFACYRAGALRELHLIL